MQTKIVTVDLDSRSYDIYVGAGLIYRTPDFLPVSVAGRSIFIVADDNVRLYASVIKNIIDQNGAAKIEMFNLPPGEQSKSFARTEEVTAWLLDKGVDRRSLVIAVGGGVTGDLVGFCASIVMRGVSFVQVPTTLLAQVDSSVGGKTGINTAQGKNLVGTFYQPASVIVDLQTLKTLPRRELVAGYAEILKYALIGDAAFFEWLLKNGQAVIDLDDDAATHAIETSIRAKARIIQGDERENGRRALLNFGHTFAHVLETACAYDGRLLHGEAVAIGMMMALELSVRLGHCQRRDYDRVEAHLEQIGLPTKATFINPAIKSSLDDLMEIMRRDKKAVSGAMRFILSGGIGNAFVADDVPEDLARQILKDSFAGGIKESKGRWTSAFLSHS